MRIAFNEEQTNLKVLSQDDLDSIALLSVDQFHAWIDILHEMVESIKAESGDQASAQPTSEPTTLPMHTPGGEQFEALTMTGLRSQSPAQAIQSTEQMLADVMEKVNTYGLPAEAYAIQVHRMLQEKLDSTLTMVQVEVLVLAYTGNTIQAHWENNQHAPR